MTPEIAYTVDQGTPAFEAARAAVDVVCLGDSLTGWNNHGPARFWPFRTHPDFLQELCEPLGLWIANGGIAGEVSDNGPQQVRDYLALFHNARYFVYGMGTNDLSMSQDTEATSNRIIDNLHRMVSTVRDSGKQTVLFNVPNANEAMFPPNIVKVLREMRAYHNAHLQAFCEGEQVPLADICSRLHDEHFGDELHPNDEGAKLIAKEVYMKLISVYDPEQGPSLKTPTLNAIEEAKRNPNGWVYEIEGNHGSNDGVPPQAIRGAWKVNDAGVIVGEFIPNPNFKSASEKGQATEQ
jgi:lysophospholipase L1-like esterase